MKILVLSNLYPPFLRGGAEYLTQQLAEELSRQGHQVNVLTTAPYGSGCWWRPKKTEENGVTVYRFSPWNFYYYLNAAAKPVALRLLWQLVNLWSPRVKAAVRNLINEFKPDLVISANLMGLGFGAVAAVKQSGCRHYHILHDVQLLHPSGLFYWDKRRDSWLARGYQFFTRRLFNGVTAAVAPSAWLMHEYERRGFFLKSFKVVLTNPVTFENLFFNSYNFSAVKELLYAGQAEEHKGVFWLIKELKNWSRTDWVLKLVLVGDKAGRRRIEKMIGQDKRFVLLPPLSQSKSDDSLAQAYLTIVPSLCYENSPTVIIKSLACGTPVLASRLGGIPELVKDKVNGWLFNAHDGDDLRAKLDWCLDRPDMVKAAGQAAVRQPVGQSLEHYAKAIVDLSGFVNFA